MRVKSISTDEFSRLTRGSTLLETCPRGHKVFLSPANDIIKVFHRKRIFSWALLHPYAVRFCRNAELLHQLGIRSVQCTDLYHDSERHRHIVVYPALPGITLRQATADGQRANELLQRLAGFIALLHARGVFFRSCHFGNVLVMEDGGFALIDVADMRIRTGALGTWRRARNFRHLLHEPRDRIALQAFGMGRFLETYTGAAGLSAGSQRALHTHLRVTCPEFLHGRHE